MKEGGEEGEEGREDCRQTKFASLTTSAQSVHCALGSRGDGRTTGIVGAKGAVGRSRTRGRRQKWLFCGATSRQTLLIPRPSCV